MHNYLNDQHIQNLSNEQSFQRGLKYYQQGRVIDFKKTNYIYHASVIGTDSYKVTLDTQNFLANCDCMAFNGELWCKHLVAVGLTLAYGEIVATKKIAIKKTGPKHQHVNAIKKIEIESEQKSVWMDNISPELDQVLSEMSEDDKNKILRHVLTMFPNVEKEITYLFIKKDDTKLFSKNLKKIVSSVKRSKTFDGLDRQVIKLLDLFADQFRSAPQNLAAVKMRLECCALVFEHVEEFGMAQDFIIGKLFAYLNVINVYLEVQPKETLVILQEYLTQDEELVSGLLRMIILSTQIECMQLIHTWIEQSNIRKLPINYHNSESFQYDVMNVLAGEGRKTFLKLIEDCDFIKDKKQLYLRYYQTIEDWDNYLQYAVFNVQQFDPIRANALLKTEQYQKLFDECNILIKTQEIQQCSNYIALIRLSLDLIKKLGISSEKSDQLQQQIYQMIEENRFISLLEKTQLYLDIHQFEKAQQTFIKYKQLLILKNKNSFGYNEKEKKKYNLLLNRWMLIEHSTATDLIIQLFNLESEFLLNSKSNHYDQIFKFLYELKHRNQNAVIDEFYDFAHTHLTTKKVLLQRLQAEFLS